MKTLIAPVALLVLVAASPTPAIPYKVSVFQSSGHVIMVQSCSPKFWKLYFNGKQIAVASATFDESNGQCVLAGTMAGTATSASEFSAKGMAPEKPVITLISSGTNVAPTAKPTPTSVAASAKPSASPSPRIVATATSGAMGGKPLTPVPYKVSVFQNSGHVIMVQSCSPTFWKLYFNGTQIAIASATFDESNGQCVLSGTMAGTATSASEFSAKGMAPETPVITLISSGTNVAPTAKPTSSPSPRT